MQLIFSKNINCLQNKNFKKTVWHILYLLRTGRTYIYNTYTVPPSSTQLVSAVGITRGVQGNTGWRAWHTSSWNFFKILIIWIIQSCSYRIKWNKPYWHAIPLFYQQTFIIGFNRDRIAKCHWCNLDFLLDVAHNYSWFQWVLQEQHLS